MSEKKSIILDSSAWIEIFSQGPKSKICQKELDSADKVYVPSLVFFEVYKKICLSSSEDIALKAVALMSTYNMVDLTRDIAISAADNSISYKIAMADSFVWTHAIFCQAKLITLDNDFVGMPSVKVIR